MNNRITAIDSLRGLIILLMILGHSRYAFSPLTFDAIELGLGSTGLYLTRVMTNMCAPIFFLLSGMGIYLLVRNYNNVSLASKDLLKRGMLLICLDLFYVSWILMWPSSYYMFFFSVLWALGVSMLILSVLIRIPIAWIFGIAVCVIVGHNAVDGVINFTYQETVGSFMLMLLHATANHIELHPYIKVAFSYAIIPWFAVMLLGYSLAHYLLAPTITPVKRQQLLIYIGLGLLCLFFLLRTVIGYGDAVNWSWQGDNPLYSLLYLFKITKYPPSFQYLCLALGVGCLLLAMFDKWESLGKYFRVYGQAALFLYIIHLPVLALTSSALQLIVFGHSLPQADVMAIPLPWIYLIWLSLLPGFYFACKWYRPVKMKHKDTFLKYI